MEKKDNFTPRVPDWKGDGISIWKDTDKNKKIVLKVKVLNGKTITCFKYTPKPKEEIQMPDLDF